MTERTTERKIDLSDYKYIVGAGMHGTIVLNKKNGTVVKLISSKLECKNAHLESYVHKVMYEQLSLVDKKYQIGTSQSIAFYNFPIRNYSCAYITGYMNPIPRYDELVHLIYKEGFKDISDRSIGKLLHKPISAQNPSRGFFASEKLVEEKILPFLPDDYKGSIQTNSDAVYRMGILFGTCVFGAKYIPTDAEYVLYTKKS